MGKRTEETHQDKSEATVTYERDSMQLVSNPTPPWLGQGRTPFVDAPCMLTVTGLWVLIELRKQLLTDS